jgi:Spy/CpxP family protein refolding chaperone
VVTTWKIIGAALVIFAAGVVTGGLTTAVAGKVARGRAGKAAGQAAAILRSGATTNASPQTKGVKPSGIARVELLARLSRQLSLSPEQRARIDEATQEGQTRLREIWEPATVRTRGELRDLRLKIEAVLTPEQRREFQKLLDRRADTKAGPSAP